MQPVQTHQFIEALQQMQQHVHSISQAKGWWDNDRNNGEAIALMHSELSEGLEALRKSPTAPSDHIPEFYGIEEEMADVIIRILDLAHARGWRGAEAVVAKSAVNAAGPHRHGGKKFSVYCDTYT